VYLTKEVATSRQIACKIVDLDEAAHKRTEGSGSDAAGEGWNERVRRPTHGKELVLREIRILSKLSHVRIAKPQCLSYTDTSQPHIVNLKKAFISNSAL
jgi:hypothetical protein